QLFPYEWNQVLTAILSQKQLFDPDSPVPEETLMGSCAPDVDVPLIISELVEQGWVEKGKGGIRLTSRSEVLLRLFAVLLRAAGKPGSISAYFESKHSPTA